MGKQKRIRIDRRLQKLKPITYPECGLIQYAAKVCAPFAEFPIDGLWEGVYWHGEDYSLTLPRASAGGVSTIPAGGNPMIFDILLTIGLASIGWIQWISYRDRRKMDGAIVQLIDSKAETLQYQLDAQFKMIQEVKNGHPKT